MHSFTTKRLRATLRFTSRLGVVITELRLGLLPSGFAGGGGCPDG